MQCQYPWSQLRMNCHNGLAYIFWNRKFLLELLKNFSIESEGIFSVLRNNLSLMTSCVLSNVDDAHLPSLSLLTLIGEIPRLARALLNEATDSRVSAALAVETRKWVGCIFFRHLSHTFSAPLPEERTFFYPRQHSPQTFPLFPMFFIIDRIEAEKSFRTCVHYRRFTEETNGAFWSSKFFWISTWILNEATWKIEFKLELCDERNQTKFKLA